MKTIIFTYRASKGLDRLPDDIQKRVTDALVEYAMHGNGDIKQLSGRPGYRLRVGSYRVIFSEDQTTILAIYIGTRSTDTYKRN